MCVCVCLCARANACPNIYKFIYIYITYTLKREYIVCETAPAVSSISRMFALLVAESLCKSYFSCNTYMCEHGQPNFICRQSNVFLLRQSHNIQEGREFPRSVSTGFGFTHPSTLNGVWRSPRHGQVFLHLAPPLWQLQWFSTSLFATGNSGDPPHGSVNMQDGPWTDRSFACPLPREESESKLCRREFAASPARLQRQNEWY